MLTDLRKKLDDKKISTTELLEEYLLNIKNKDNLVGSFVTVCEDEAREQAKNAQELINKGHVRPLTGIPISIKDNICTKDIKTTCSSKMLSDFIPPYDATTIKKLKGYGSVIIGKTNMDEFAMGGSSQTSYYGGVKNPYDLERVPGGSSGGAAASVCAKFAPCALGSDTGGSIRQPASFCGVTGLKPSYGVVSRYGLVAFGSSLDQIGPIANSARDCAIVLDAISDFDPNDRTMSPPNCYNYGEKIGMPLTGYTFGVPKEFFDGIDNDVATAVGNALKEYEKMGAKLIDVSMPSLKYAVSAYYLLSSAEAASNLARYDGVKFGYKSSNCATYDELIKNTRAEGFGKEVKRRILLGNYALSSGYYDDYYKKAMLIRDEIKYEYDRIFETCNAIITPTAPSVAYKIGQYENDPVKMYLADILTVTQNLAGLPAINTTCGYNSSNMPIGMSITGKRFDEVTIIQIADAFEKGFTKQEVSL